MYMYFFKIFGKVYSNSKQFQLIFLVVIGKSRVETRRSSKRNGPGGRVQHSCEADPPAMC